MLLRAQTSVLRPLAVEDTLWPLNHTGELRNACMHADRQIKRGTHVVEKRHRRHGSKGQSEQDALHYCWLALESQWRSFMTGCFPRTLSAILKKEKAPARQLVQHGSRAEASRVSAVGRLRGEGAPETCVVLSAWTGLRVSGLSWRPCESSCGAPDPCKRPCVVQRVPPRLRHNGPRPAADEARSRTP